MSTPSNPSLTDIVQEGFRKAGVRSPTSDSNYTRAQTQWMAEIKNELSKKVKKLKFLHITSYGVFTRGLSRYSNPTDYESDLNLTLLDGELRGIATGGSSSTIILAANTNATENDLIGKEIVVMSGTGQASASQIIGYDSSTQTVTVSPDFRSAPAASSEYMVVTSEYPLTQDHVFNKDQGDIIRLELPTRFYLTGDEDYGEFIFNNPPDKVYAGRLRYYADIGKMDTDSQHLSTLYHKYRNLWVYGIAWKYLEENDNSRYANLKQDYLDELHYIAMSQYGFDINQMQTKVCDYQ